MTSLDTIYLDHAATSGMRRPVLDALMPHLTEHFGHPSSVYASGREARHTLEQCRARIAQLIGAGPAEVFFTSGGSESNNTAIRSASRKGAPFLTSGAEHEAVLEPVRKLDVGAVQDPDKSGCISPSMLDADSIRGGALSLMLVNNELGSINPIRELADFCHKNDALIHTDAVQAARVLDLTQIVPAVDYLSLSGHKIGGPKGIGLLYVRAGAPFVPLILGGGQEQDRRAGTENVASIVGFATALEYAVDQRAIFVEHCRSLRSAVIDGLVAELGVLVEVNSPSDNSAPHIVNLLLLDDEGNGLDGEMLLLGLDIEGVFVSAGSACSSGTVKTSHVLKAIGIAEQKAKGAIRISFGPGTTVAEVNEAVRRIVLVSKRMRTGQI